MVNLKTPFLLIFALTGALSAGCRDSRQFSKGATDKARGAAAGCNVLVITLDTTRADRLGCYGWAPALTPALDGLAQRGIRFEQALSPLGLTLPAHTVLFTGTYPPENGVHDNYRDALGPELTTLAEIFRQHGYRTGAFVASEILKSRYGLTRGFDVYDDRMEYFRKPANEVSDAALIWLRQPSDRPFFAWVHFYDAHWPYTPPPEYFDKTKNRYDAAVAFIDTHVGRLMSWLRDSSLLDKTLVVAVADHGESLGEHGYEAHALLIYDSMLRIPLIFSLPGRLPENVTCDGVVRTADLMPTILDLLNWPIPSEVSGESFLAALSGQALPARFSYGETDYPYNNYGWSKLRCLVERQWKYIRAPRVELYDRAADPGELYNLADAQPEHVARLETALSDWEQRMPQRHGTALPEDPASLAALRALGYVGGPPPSSAPTTELKDPKDMVDVANNYRKAETQLRGRQPLEVIALMQPAVRRSPESFVLVELLGKAYANAGLLDLGELELQAALALYSGSAETWLHLAKVLAARNAMARAIQACERSLALDPSDDSAKDVLKKLQQSMSQQQARLAEARRQFQADPRSIPAASALSKGLAVAGAMDEAIRVLKTALEKNPDNPYLANDLAWYLATTADDALRNPPEALHWARVASRGDFARNPQVLDTLAAALAATGDFDGAATTIRNALKLAAAADDKLLPIALSHRLAEYEAKRAYRAPE